MCMKNISTYMYEKNNKKKKQKEKRITKKKQTKLDGFNSETKKDLRLCDKIERT